MAKKVVKTLFDLFKKRIYFPDFLLNIFFVVYVIYTHVYDEFDRTPYIGIFGPHDSGKSRMGDFLEGLCFKGNQTSDITAAALFRSVAQERGTIIIDEGLHNESRFDSLNRILRSGYKKNGRVKCCEPGGIVVAYPTFCPKVIINTSEPNDQALSSRIIAIYMTRSPHRLERFLDSEAQNEFTAARGLITTFWEKNLQSLSEHYKSSKGFDAFLNRDEELWTPLLIVSEFLDSLLGEDFFLKQMLLLAHKLMDSKKREELENSLDLQIIEGTLAYMDDPNTNPIKGNLYEAFEIRNFVRKRWNLTGLSTKKVVQTLKLYQVRGDRERPHILERQPVCYSIDRKRLFEIIEKYLDGGERKS
jgi:hypothetical protein